MTKETKNTSIKVPGQFYVGLKVQSHNESNVPLGFATPYEPNTAAYEKRLSTINTWCNFNNRVWNPDTKIYDPIAIPEPIIINNTPVSGFKIADSIRRVYWGGGNVVWRIEDPRGYELEISSSNLAKILDCTTIKDGEIMIDCVWGRDKSQNVLLPTNSEPYKEAMTNTVRESKKVSLKDVKIGDTVLMKNGTSGIYAGGFNVLTHTSKPSGWTGDQITTINFCDIKRRFALKVKITKDSDQLWSYKSAGIQEGDDAFMFFSEMAVSEILQSTTETSVSFLSEVRDFITLSKHHYFGIDDAYFITDKPLKQSDVQMVYVPVELDELTEAILLCSDTRSYARRTRPCYVTSSNQKLVLRTSYNNVVGAELTPFSWDKGNNTTLKYNHLSQWSTKHLASQLVSMGTVSKIAYVVEGGTYVPEGYL
jgi:hypothetical protein